MLPCFCKIIETTIPPNGSIPGTDGGVEFFCQIELFGCDCRLHQLSPLMKKSFEVITD
jgi:hypothetical protein